MPNHPSPSRRHDIDSLRALATLSLILFHTARVFDTERWHIKNETLSPIVDVGISFMNAWHMPLFFVLAGCSAAYSLRRRTNQQYIDERISRLLVPLFWGVVLVVPLQVYIERISIHRLWRQSPIDFQGSFFEFYPRFFTQGIYPEGNFSWHHLWFLCYLFLLSLLLLPFFRRLSQASDGAAARWSGALSKGSAIFLLAAPIVVVETALFGAFPGPQNIVNDLTNIFRSGLLMVYGFLIAQDPRLKDAIARNGFRSLLLAVAATVILASVLIGRGWPAPYSGLYFVVMPIWAVARWTWLLFILYLGDRFLTNERPWVRHFSQIAFPFYIVHQTVIVAVAHVIVDRPLGIAAKFCLIALTSLVLSWALSEALRLTALTRWMFGIKAGHQTPPVSSYPATTGKNT